MFNWLLKAPLCADNEGKITTEILQPSKLTRKHRHNFEDFHLFPLFITDDQIIDFIHFYFSVTIIWQVDYTI